MNRPDSTAIRLNQARPLGPNREGLTPLPRLFLFEPGWRVVVKPDSAREFCHAIAPGQTEYHRLSQGELYLEGPEEKLCLVCARRRGLLTTEPLPLKQPTLGRTIQPTTAPDQDDAPLELVPEPTEHEITFPTHRDDQDFLESLELKPF